MESLRTTVAAKKLPVTLLGFVNVDRLAEVYCAADILAHPSELDPHPLVLSEAACVGLPLLISDRVGAAGPTDIAREGENAVVYPCGDVRALTDAVLRFGRRAGDGRANVESVIADIQRTRYPQERRRRARRDRILPRQVLTERTNLQ